MMRKRRGASPIIAALLLIAIAVAGAVVTYSWVMSMVKNQGSDAQTAIRIDEVLLGGVGGDFAVKITIRNTGSVPTTIETVYLYKGDAQIATLTSVDMPIADRELGTLSMESNDSVNWTTFVPAIGVMVEADRNNATSGDFDLVAGSGYLIKVVTDNGFSVEGTYYAPSIMEEET